jgi:hypothetical protein
MNMHIMKLYALIFIIKENDHIICYIDAKILINKEHSFLWISWNLKPIPFNVLTITGINVWTRDYLK